MEYLWIMHWNLHFVHLILDNSFYFNFLWFTVSFCYNPPEKGKNNNKQEHTYIGINYRMLLYKRVTAVFTCAFVDFFMSNPLPA